MQAAGLARQAHGETTAVERDLIAVQRLLENGKPDPVQAMLLAQRIYARHHQGTSATAARNLLVEAAAAAARYAAGSVDRNAAVEALNAAADRLQTLRPASPSPLEAPVP